jgi:pilus assembly protein CpaE
MKQLKILISGRDKPALEALANTVAGTVAGQAQDISIRHIYNGHADPLYGVEEMPDLLIFHAGSAGETELEALIERPAETRPVTLVIGPAGNTALMRMAMKAGARDFLEDPVDKMELNETLAQISKDFRQDISGASGSKLVSVVSAKGGSGASFLSVNLAHMMAASSNQRVALLDLDLQFGSLGQYLDITPQHGLMHALDMADQLDVVALDAYMAKHKSGVSLLGPLQEELVLARDIPLDRFGRLLDLLKENYDCTVVDQPRQIDDVSAEVYERADHILLVMQQELANIRDANRLRQILLRDLAIPEERLTIVVNRYDKNLPVELADISRSLGVEKNQMVLVPNHYKNVAESMNVGIPMLDHARSSSVTKALLALQNQLSGNTQEQPTGLFSKAFSNIMRG